MPKTTVKDWLSQAIQQLDNAGVSSPRLDALIVLESILKKDRSVLIANDDALLKTDQLNAANSMLTRRAERIPLAYILGEREFYGLSFNVDEQVLVPRPETEMLVEYASKNTKQSARVLELGTGSGCISIALSHVRPDLKINATDVSPGALRVAKSNNLTLGTSVKFTRSDLFKSLPAKQYDAVLANLPYVPEPARRQPEITHEPDIALYGGEDGLDFYRSFFAKLEDYLHPNGFSVIEFSPTQFAAVRSEFTKYLFTPVSEYIYLVTPR